MSSTLHTPAHRQLARRLAQLRRDAGLSQRALADRLGREQNLVARVETAERRLDLVELIRHVRACGAADPVAVVAGLATEVASLDAPPRARPSPRPPEKPAARNAAKPAASKAKPRRH